MSFFLLLVEQVLLLAIPGFLISTSMIAVLVVKVFAYNWDWYVGMMFGAIVSTTDPFLSSTLLRSLGESCKCHREGTLDALSERRICCTSLFNDLT